MTASRGAPSPSATDKRDVIILARHGRPDLDHRAPMGWRGYREWWSAYQESGLAPDQSPPQELIDEAANADVIYSSTLNRSIETAKRVAGEKPVEPHEVFVEAPLPPPSFSGVRLKPRQWGVVARTSWWMGFARGEETRVQAELRADAAVAHVEKAAQGGRTVLVCGHGWFNRMMRPVLLARGWTCVRDGRDGYWSFRRYERPSV